MEDRKAKMIEMYEEKTNTTALEALRKQLPERPELIGDGFYNGDLILDVWICPTCRTEYEVFIDEYDYCPHCGQKINWEGKQC